MKFLTSLFLLPVVVISRSYDCYNQKCQGTQKWSSKYVSCDQTDMYCKRNSYGYPSCSLFGYGGTQSGVFCSASEYSCNYNSSTGVAYCDNTKYDCFDQKCQGTQSFSSKYISCDQSNKYCRRSSYGYPSCSSISGTKGGMACSQTGFTCKSYSFSGEAYCKYYEYDCYNQKCAGTGSYLYKYVDCDLNNKYLFCKTSSSGSPICSPFSGTQGGVNCTGSGFTCNHQSYTGIAYCDSNRNYDCYDKKCQGTTSTGSYSYKYIDCDQSYEFCSTSSSGSPSCNSYSGNQSGVYCSESYFTCNSNSSTGVAYCNNINIAPAGIIAGIVGGMVFIVVVCCCYCRRRRRIREQQHAVVVQQATVTAPAPAPIVTQNINPSAPPQYPPVDTFDRVAPPQYPPVDNVDRNAPPQYPPVDNVDRNAPPPSYQEALKLAEIPPDVSQF